MELCTVEAESVAPDAAPGKCPIQARSPITMMTPCFLLGVAFEPRAPLPSSSFDPRTPLAVMQQAPQRARSQPALIDAKRPGFEPEKFKTYANPDRFEGTSLTITEYPSPILRAKNADITEFDDALARLCSEFFSVMYGANGVGLAAPQVGLNLRLFVYNVDPTAPGALRKLGERIVVNPKIVEYSAATDIDIEGCLSSRSECCIGNICRASSLSVEYQDERGRLKKKRLRGFEARVFQHEMDHIAGVLHLDRQSDEDRAKIRPYLEVLEELHGPGAVCELAPESVTRLQPPPLTGATSPPPVPAAATPTKRVKSKPAAQAPAPARTAGFGAGAGARKGKDKPPAKAKRKKR